MGPSEDLAEVEFSSKMEASVARYNLDLKAVVRLALANIGRFTHDGIEEGCGVR